MSAPFTPPTALPFELVLEYEGLVVAVHTASPGHLRWLEEFLSPHFAIGADMNPQCRVLVYEDSAAYARELQRTAAGQVATIDCFALDSSVVSLPIWRDDDDGVTVFDDDYRIFFTVSRDQKTVTILSPSGNGRLRTPLMRVVRELAMNHCRDHGGLFLHASALADGRRGLVITGHKAAGKTTLLLHLLCASEAQYVANDRVLVSLASQPPILRGMPSVVTIREPTLGMFPAVGRQLRTSGFQQPFTLAEAAQRPQDSVRPWSDGRYGLTPAQLCVLAGSRSVAACELQAVVFPRITGQPGGIEVVPLSSAAASAALVPSLLGAGSWKKSSDLFTLSPGASLAPDQSMLTDLCERLAQSVACYDCFIGLDAYETPDSASVLLRLIQERP